MGYLTALALAEALPLEDAIRMHFSTNCYPSIPRWMVPPAAAAVAAARIGDWDLVIELPEGVSDDEGIVRRATAAKLVKDLRLAAFVDYTEHTDDPQIGFDQGSVVWQDPESFREYLAGLLPG